ncbi:MAG: hypothetical protein NC181_03935 [Clostridium sp.]|nr:hypothetical protein [Clostridium sp.]MCM1444383.1 hypothetical protein [Candidatus Amulumruptor caecigallinarius]
MDKYNEFSNKYDTFIYEGFDIENLDKNMKITFHYNVLNLTTYNPTLEMKKFEINDFTKYLIFNIGMVELISYWKATCSKNVIIKAGYLDEDQIKFFKKLYFYGLGELFFTNGITVNIDDFMNIKCDCSKENIEIPCKTYTGNLIPIGGGKDSNVTLELLKDDYNNNDCFIINPKQVTLECAYTAGYKDNKIITVKRTIDKNLIELNKQGFINGHTPFSALVAFISFLNAYILGKKYIVLSNEASANESNVSNTKINHQYSKTYEFENDFNSYVKKYFKVDIKYFSLLRPLSEYQIGMLFSKYEKYHSIFKSCNVGSKTEPWKWCCNCPKCLFVYIILSPFLYKEKLVNIFGEDLYEREDLLDTFIELTGYGDTKPFECVGTYKEVRYALSKVIINNNNLPYLLKYYKDNYELSDMNENLENEYNEENNLDEYFEKIIKKELNTL